MGNIDTLLQIFTLAREIGNEAIAKEAIVAIAGEYNIVPANQCKSLAEIRLYTPQIATNRITAIKELRERASENGILCSLMEAKDEVDRRAAEQRRKEEKAREAEYRY
jgi:ribosomal protein L7/L12